MKKRRKQFFRVSPYLYQLVILGTCGILLCTALTAFFLYTQSHCSILDFLVERGVLLLLPLCPLVVFLTVCIINSCEYFGKVLIDESRIVCYAPFRKALIFKYSEIREIGIDYAWLTVNKQYWIYIGSAKIPNNYCHKINRLPINQNYLRIQFSEDVFSALLQHLPVDLKKALYRSKTLEVTNDARGTH